MQTYAHIADNLSLKIYSSAKDYVTSEATKETEPNEPKPRIRIQYQQTNNEYMMSDCFGDINAAVLG